MFFKNRRKRKKSSKEQYVNTVIENSQLVNLNTIEFLNMKTKKIEKLFPEECIKEWNTKLAICDIQQDAVAEKMFLTDVELDMIILLSFNTIHIYILNLFTHNDEIDQISDNIMSSIKHLYKSESAKYVEFVILIEKDKLQWFDKARLNAFMRAAGNVDFPVSE